MAWLLPAKAKRKKSDEAHDEFSEFSFSYPARKMPRLAAKVSYGTGNELPTTLPFNQHLIEEKAIASTSSTPDVGPVVTEALPPCFLNEERALVLYQPAEKPLILSPLDPNMSFRVSADMIQGLKDYAFKQGDRTGIQLDGKTAVYDNSLALVPWVPPQTSSYSSFIESTGPRVELIEDEEAEAAPMEIEGGEQAPNGEINNEGVYWQQQCMTSQPLPEASSTLMWS